MMSRRRSRNTERDVLVVVRYWRVPGLMGGVVVVSMPWPAGLVGRRVGVEVVVLVKRGVYAVLLLVAAAAVGAGM